ncbi:MAG: hypothetical protein AAGD05_06710, partial [Bacteroidota bacterium]
AAGYRDLAQIEGAAGAAHAATFDDYWTDIGTIRSFYEANIDLANHYPQFNLLCQQSFYTTPSMLSPSRILDTQLSQTLIAEGSLIEAQVIRKSGVGLRARIGRNTQVIQSVIFGNDYVQSLEELINTDGGVALGIGQNCTIKHAIIDKNCRIGDHVSIIGHPSLAPIETPDYCIIDGIVVVKKGAFLPDHTTIGWQATAATEEPSTHGIRVVLEKFS